MSNRSKHFYLVVLGQTLCVAVGLWMQYQLLTRSAQQAAEDQIWSDLEADAAFLIRQLETPEFADAIAEPQTRERVQKLLDQQQRWECDVLVVDRRWCPLLQSWPEQHQPGSPLPPEQPVSWTASSRPTAEPTKFIRGTLNLPEGSCIAVAYPFAGRETSLLLHRPADDVEAAAAPFAKALLPVGAIALLWTVTLLSITVYLILARYDDTFDQARAQSESGAMRQAQRLIRTRDAVIFALAKLAGHRDDETGAHLERLSDYSTLLASALRRHPKYSAAVTPAFVRLVGLSSVPHDIGKVGIEDCILRKPGKLTADERREMQKHTAIAGHCFGEIIERLGSSNFLEMARDIAVAHHEHWDGNGYPRGLSGEAIPLAARIVAIADVYDALSSRRVYREALPHEQCVAIIRDAAGTHFDPELVKIWLTIESKFREIAEQHARCEKDAAPPSSDTIPPDSDEEGGRSNRSRFLAEPANTEREVLAESKELN
jgi:HD-GYP domain-containing protein (c-di-GMP phosphodiesterase class II)